MSVLKCVIHEVCCAFSSMLKDVNNVHIFDSVVVKTCRQEQTG